MTPLLPAEATTRMMSTTTIAAAQGTKATMTAATTAAWFAVLARPLTPEWDRMPTKK